ncbi:reverse transcriptase family protein [Actinoplanes sp. N902-109]|uniref:reverse transcriptase family protein n=1 Tax=Actinoplanes sp. (strain N902-109) TaxID=649831 RepID=UPI0003A76BA0|nr:reverse transcriptase family protein [Actinoplanes sp. N902-109]
MRQAVNSALAEAFLACGWRDGPARPALDRLTRAGAEVLGGRPWWLRPLAAEVLRAHRNPPLDRPRELAAFLGRRVAGSRPIMVRRAVPVRTVRMRWPTPRIDDLAALADFLGLTGEELDWFADRREINRHARAEQLRHYRYRWLPHRLIEAPKPRLRALHRRLLDDLLGRLPVHDAAHGFVPGRSVHTFAAPHAGRALVIRADLATFFSSITAPRIFGLFRTAGYPEPVAHALTGLTTTRTPAAVLRGHGYDTARMLRQPHLPQGAPTSPALANLVAFRLDRRLAGLAARFDLTYTRYADDLAFSGPRTDPRRFLDALRTVVADEGFRLHPAKTRVRGRADRQSLAGLVVNEHPAVPRTDYDRLRAILHDAARHGLATANRDGHPDFAAYLTGRVAWIAHHHPTRAAKLHRMLAAALNPPPP